MRARAPEVVAFCLLFGFTDLAAVAATPSASELQAIQREQEQLLRMEEERRREQERLRKLKELQPPEPEEKPEHPSVPESERCIQVDRIRVLNADIVSDADIAQITDPLRQSCLKTNQLQQLLQQLNDLFRDAGYVTSRAYLPEQDLQDGILIIQVLQGTISNMTLGEGRRADRWQLYFAFPTSEGEVLNIRDIEQGLEQMNRLASNNATMSIEPGQEAGTSVVAVTNKTSRPFRVEIGRDNSGTNSTGILRDTANVYLDNILGINDGWSFYFSKNARGVRQTRRSNSATGTFTVPFGYSTLTYTSSYYSYKTLSEGDTQSFFYSGLSTSDMLELSHVAHRDQSSKTRIDLGITRKRARNFVDDSRQSSSRNLAIGHLALAHSRRAFDGVLSAEIRHERGMKILGAKEDDPDQDHGEAKAQFRKWILEAAYSRNFSLDENMALAWSSSANWQYAQDGLFGSEQIGVGGLYSVRGFREDSLSGDTGGYWRNELALNGIDQDWGLFEPVVGSITPYVAFDMGRVLTNRGDANEKGTVSGWSVGLRNDARYFRFDLQFSQGLAAPQHLEKESHEFNFNATLRF
ncbi:ShlB/FhaC/HecB family hemolysin secretion/activation protein [Aestuariispira insulae]|nr:ShlB/FhaC/HecB family hemolysin secretion/activation protein [Aestuariispira insulae]